MDKTQELLDYGIEFLKGFAPRLIAAILILIVGMWAVNKIVKTTSKVMAKKEYDESLVKFLLNLLSWMMRIFLVILVISQLGVDVTTFAAIIAAAGLAIGLALQGSLSNFAGGVLILIFKPYKIGDLIEAQGEMGVVKEIEIFTTKIISMGNRLVFIPNGAMANGNIKNHTTEGKVRVDLVIGIGYDEDIKEAKTILLNLLTSHPLVLEEPAPSVNVLSLGDFSINLAVRPFTKPEDHWRVYFDIMESTKYALDEAGIEIPYPHTVEIQKKV